MDNLKDVSQKIADASAKVDALRHTILQAATDLDREYRALQNAQASFLEMWEASGCPVAPNKD